MLVSKKWLYNSFFIFLGIIFIGAQSVKQPVLKDSIKAFFKDKEKSFNPSQEALHLFEQAQKTGKSVEDVILDEIQQEEEDFWQEIQASTGKRKKMGQMGRSFSLPALSKNTQLASPSLSPDTIAIVREVMAEFGIDENKILIRPGRATQLNGCTLEINEERHMAKPVEQAKSVIAHELVHYVYGDCFTRVSIQSILSDGSGQYTNKVRANYNRYLRFQELRADKVAASKNIEYAKGLRNFFEALLEKCGDRGGNSHPKTSERFAQSDRIYQAKLLEQSTSF